MVCGPLHVYGDAPTVAGTNLNVAVPRIRRPSEIRTVALKRSLTGAITIQLVAKLNGWGPFTFILATGVTTTEWNQLVQFSLPIGSEVSLQTSGLAGTETIQGAVVVEEMAM
jgi:hypothetical protein